VVFWLSLVLSKPSIMVKGKGKKKTGGAPTVDQIQSDEITQLANEYWAPYSSKPHKAFNAKVSTSLPSVWSL
jgi:hypothetical protein